MEKYNNIFINFISILNNNWIHYSDKFINYLIIYKKFEFIIPIIEFINLNKSILLFIGIIFAYMFSNQVLYFTNLFMLFDSVILSLLILQNNSLNVNSRRLSKNVILTVSIYFNLIGSLLTFIFVIFIYSEFSKFINRIIFKFIKFFIKIITNTLPFLSNLYPDVKYFNFDDPDQTLKSSSVHKKILSSKKIYSNKKIKNKKYR